jgi:hypothetical protein
MFVQEEGEEEWNPYWWKDVCPSYLPRMSELIQQGKFGESGQSSGSLDRDEGHTMRHLHGHEPAIEWYEPPGTSSPSDPIFKADGQSTICKERQ